MRRAPARDQRQRGQQARLSEAAAANLTAMYEEAPELQPIVDSMRGSWQSSALWFLAPQLWQ